MFKKLSNSLLSPKEVAKYYGESFGKTFVFLLLMLFLLLVVTFVSIMTTSALTEDIKKEIKKTFVNEEIAFVIEDGVLKNINNDNSAVYKKQISETMFIVFSEDIEKVEASMDTVTFILTNDGVYTKYPIVYKIMEFKDFEYLKNLDFSNKEILSDISFWDNIFNVVETVLGEYKPIFVVIGLIYNFMYLAGLMMAIALITTFFSKMRTSNFLSFGSIFKLTIYNLAPFVICLIFSTLFNIAFLMWIGYILTAVYNFITINEVLKNLYLNRNEGE